MFLNLYIYFDNKFNFNFVHKQKPVSMEKKITSHLIIGINNRFYVLVLIITDSIKFQQF